VNHHALSQRRGSSNYLIRPAPTIRPALRPPPVPRTNPPGPAPAPTGRVGSLFQLFLGRSRQSETATVVNALPDYARQQVPRHLSQYESDEEEEDQFDILRTPPTVIQNQSRPPVTGLAMLEEIRRRGRELTAESIQNEIDSQATTPQFFPLQPQQIITSQPIQPPPPPRPPTLRFPPPPFGARG
jgi:hypothetical protein